jgi:hypothetical protein
MGRTWKSVILAVVVNLVTISSAQGQIVPFLADADARACLARSYSVLPWISGGQSVRPNEAWITDADRPGEAVPPDALAIVSYVAALELLLAVMAAIACLLALAVAGVVVRAAQRRRHRAAVPAKSSFGVLDFLPAEKFPI